MPVKYKIFPIPITNPEEQEEALNQFLCMHKIVTIHKEIIQEQSRHYVCFIVEYLQKKGTSLVPKSSNTIPDIKKVLLLPSSKKRFIHKLVKYELKYEQGIWSEEILSKHLTAMIAFIAHADSKGFQRNNNLGFRLVCAPSTAVKRTATVQDEILSLKYGQRVSLNNPR